jgi:diaminopimelate decarboxylase
MILVQSPNSEVRPSSAAVNAHGHLTVGGLDTVELARKFGTPLWIMDEQTMTEAMSAYKTGLQNYPAESQVLYAGKAFLCTSMVHLLRQNGLGLDVVSQGELVTAIKANLPADLIFMHGNNKSDSEIAAGLVYGDVKVVVDSLSELRMVAKLAERLKKRAEIFIRVIPGVEPDTHAHIVTGHSDSKFGVPLESLEDFVREALSLPTVELLGLHAHIGSQAHDLEPYYQNVEIMADAFAQLRDALGITLTHLDVGGGLGIAYTSEDKTTPIVEWTRGMANRVQSAFAQRELPLPKLYVEPGRSIVGSAGVTVYTVGHIKELPSGKTFVAVDGGMADNPRPITYDAKYTCAVASRMNSGPSTEPVTLVGKFCESGDIIIKETHIAAETGDLIAVFGTGAYNYSMASNYNRTARPACVLVSNGEAETIIERESFEDLLRQDRVPKRLLR